MKVDFLPPGSPLEICTADERPDLWEVARSLFEDVWPEYNLHGNHTGRIFRSLVPAQAHLQVLVHNREIDRIVARGRTIQFHWDGSLDDLPDGVDSVGLRAQGDPRPPNCLSALAAEVETDQQGRGLSRFALQAMAVAAKAGHLSQLVAPVRPSKKHEYPLIPIEQYCEWNRSDGLPFDPWIRVHARLGATILRPEPRSLQIEASKANWQEWTGMVIPEDGEYVFPPFGLALLTVQADVGSYWEPNVWMLHTLD